MSHSKFMYCGVYFSYAVTILSNNQKVNYLYYK